MVWLALNIHLSNPTEHNNSCFTQSMTILICLVGIPLYLFCCLISYIRVPLLKLEVLFPYSS